MNTWSRDAKAGEGYPKLQNDIDADIVIIGGGITGIVNAYLLSQTGKKVVLIEAGRLGGRVTRMTTAIITQVLDTSAADTIGMIGLQDAKVVWDASGQAIDEIEKIVNAEKIDSEFMLVPNYFFASTNRQFQELKQEFDSYKALGVNSVLSENRSELNFQNFGFIKISDQAKFHPLKFISGVASAAARHGVQIFEGTKALEISKESPFIVKTESGNISAKEVVLATHRLLTDEKTHLKKALYRSYVFEVNIPKNVLPEAVYEDFGRPYYYFRVDKGEESDRLIFGGEDHKDIFGHTLVKKSFAGLERHLQKLLPDVEYKIINKWHGPILEPSDGLPLIGKIRDHLFVATAFSGNGMTYSVVSAMLLRDLIAGEENKLEKIFDPTRKMQLKRLALIAKGYAKELFGGAVKNLLGI